VIFYDYDELTTLAECVFRELPQSDDVYDELAAEGLPLKPDRDQAWRDFAGWRVNYDPVVVGLAQAIMAPPAPWSSDRAPVGLPRRFRPWIGDG
jgi:hypothetical protein